MDLRKDNIMIIKIALAFRCVLDLQMVNVSLLSWSACTVPLNACQVVLDRRSPMEFSLFPLLRQRIIWAPLDALRNLSLRY